MDTSNDIWKNYKKVLWETFPDLENICDWADWEGKNLNLSAKLYNSPYILKAREVEIWNEKTCIYNTIIYPKTGSDLPCFGMDLMMFFPKKVVLTFDFQHPRENYLFSVPNLPKCEGGIRFFEPGNHFSENLYIRKCTSEQVDDYLNDFKTYLQIFAGMLNSKKPTGLDISKYTDFDQYMTKLDPVAGYLSSNFGKEQSEKLVKEFLFTY
ncbi:ferredoxin oxidoreductase [Synechococcus virus S-PRM1]|uniref:Phycoerythrobilin n=1 Tax=Synechococcus virus S-PRM1 TaxID=2100130 RepID=A0A346FKD4_9CAUD|nr:ferredoxin oxidoreductase [Synechococcus virus S-PRM1]AXN58439.1 hypothetical protein [Synechococcus virus S-PRM1]